MNEFTRDVYWEHQPPELRIFRTDANPPNPSMDPGERESKAAELNAQGFVIDREIMIYGWDPVLVMAYRRQLGYAWCPNAFQPNLVDPFKTGVVASGSTPTDMSKPWPRSIKVSIDAADYAPFESVPPPLLAPHPVGVFIGNGIYAVNTQVCWSSVTGNWLYREGSQETAQDGTPVFWHMGVNIMGASPMWETAAVRDQRLKGQ